MATTAKTSLLIQRILSLSFSNIWRNKALTFATVFVMAIILFIFNIILSINFISQKALMDLNKKVDVVIYLKETTTSQEIQQLINYINSLEGIAKVTYTSKEDALNQIKQTHPDLSFAFEKYSLGNPLPASINIVTLHPKYHETISQALNDPRYKSYLTNIISDDNNDNALLSSVSRNLISVTNFTNQIVFWLITTFIVGGALVILNALQITIFSRRKEIAVMKLVGASYNFIRMPFIIESIIYGLLALLLSFIILFAFSNQVEIKDAALIDYYSGTKFYLILAVEVVATIVLSVISSLTAVHEHLQNEINHN